jgi:hypothetical protein
MPNVRQWAEARFRGALGEVEEADTVEPEAEPEPGESRILPPWVAPNGKLQPRFKAFHADIVPPPASPQYRRDPSYAAGQDWHSDTVRRARDNHAAWLRCHAEATNDMLAWLAEAGCLGDDTRAAYAARSGVEAMRAQAEANVIAARARADQARAGLADGVRQAVAGEGDLPAGGPVIGARLDVEAFELVAELVKAAAPGVHQAWGRAVQAADWRQTLERVQHLDGPDADTATAWLRAKVDPPAGPREDPLRWL